MPDWVAQRLWIGTLVFAAGDRRARAAAGCSAWRHRGATPRRLVYRLSPYLLDYVNRTSVLLAPWAALGWLIGVTVLAGRRGGWR